MKLALILGFITLSAFAQDEPSTVKNAVTGTATTFDGVGTKITNINISLFGTHRLVGTAELDNSFSSKYLWTNVPKKEIVQQGRSPRTVFLYEGPYNYPAVTVAGNLVRTEKGYSAKEIQFSYADPQSDGTEVTEKVSGFLIKYGDSNSYLVSWTFKESQHDGDDNVFAGRLHGNIKLANTTLADGRKAIETTYELHATNLKQTQVANFMKWWLSCTSQPPPVE